VTFAFTDVVGSTLAFAEHGDRYVDALRLLQATVAEQTERHGGTVVNTEGDGAFLAFSSAAAAVDALRGIVVATDQRAQDTHVGLRVRAGAHAGDATPIGDDYLAFSVHVAARVAAAAGAGQVLASGAVVEELGGDVGESLGSYTLKDIPGPVGLWRLAGGDAPPRATPTRLTNVAVPRTPFMGRDPELAWLTEALARPGLVTIVGTGGLGKTRLASEFALRHAGVLAGGAWLAELAPVADPAELLARVAEATAAGGAVEVATLTDELSRRGPLLLVIDNCEHLVDACADLASELLARCPELRLLCTSREALALDGERVLRLAPLTTAPDGGGAAEALFVSRAGAAGVVIGDGELGAVTDVCRLLDGLPLGLELAAARLSSVPLPDLVEALHGGEIELHRRGGDRRQRSLDALVEWSLRLLDDGDRGALLALSVFPGRFSAGMADSVLRGDPAVRPGALARLAARSLVDLDGDHYRMLVTTREVARRQLAGSPARLDAARSALMDWASEAAKDSDTAMRLTPDEVQALQAGLDWGLERRVPGRGAVMDRLARWELARSRSATSVELARRALSEPEPDDADEVLLHLGAMRLIEGLGSTSVVPLEDLRRIAARARSLGDPGTLAKALRAYAMSLGRQGRHDEAVPLLHEVLALGDDNAEVDQSRTLIDFGVALHLVGDLSAAEANYRRALERLGLRDVNRGLALANLAEVLLDAGRLDEARDQLRAAIRETIGRPNLSAWSAGLLVEAEARLGNLEVALALAAQAEIELRQVLESDPSVAYVRDRMRHALRDAGGTAAPLV
jgi:predicted ATPase/class 3 adenylate cyclase